MLHKFHSALRWLLFLWIRVDVFPRETPPFAFDAKRPTLYVLADRGISDLLVLSQITRNLKLPDPLFALTLATSGNNLSVYHIASPNPMVEWLRRRPQSALLQDVLFTLQQDKNFDLQIIPVSVYWGRPLAKQKHWLLALFADTWSVAGRIRKFFTLLTQGRNTRLLFSQPLDLKTIAQACDYSAEALHELLLNQLTQQREATFGPQITSRKLLTNEVLDTPALKQTIEEIAGNSNYCAKTNAKAKRYCREIFADCTQITIELMLRLLRFFWRRFYAGIDTYNIDQVKQAALTHQIVYVPCHRSHVDYLLLSYVIYNENLAIPYIAAGSNLNLPFIGRILRGGGAFFIRRSFKDNPLYSGIVRAYLQRLMAMGVPLEYFIEGGRSRTGRMLKPKLGMLDMTVEGFIKTQARPLAFVPVYIGYEKLLEGKSYLGELYGGKKQSESLFGAMTAILKLKGEFGRVTASFGQPIILTELLDSKQPDWNSLISEVNQKPEWYRDTISVLAQRIMYGINRACVINPVNLIATILLATPRQSIDMLELVEQSEMLSQLIISTPKLNNLAIPYRIDQAQIERLSKQKLLHIREHNLGNIIYLKPEDSILMGYYRNNSLHAFVIPALIACCFVNTRQMARSKLTKVIQLLYPFLQSELQLEWNEAELSELITQYTSVLIAKGLLVTTKNSLRRPDRSDHSYIFLNRLALVVQPILERYYMTFIVLWESAEAPMNEPELEQRCHLLAQKISMLYGINSPDFFDRPLFRHFIETMINLGYLVENEQQKLIFSDNFSLVNLDIRNLLSVDIRNSILTLIRQHQP